MLVGEMRDLETIEAALTIAETGHLAFAHAAHQLLRCRPSTASSTCSRRYQQPQVRAQLSFVLEGVLSPDAAAAGRAARAACSALEVMVPNAAIRNLIREDKVHQIYSQMQVGQAKFGMQTFNQSPGRAATRSGSSRSRRRSAARSDPDELKNILASGTAAVRCPVARPRRPSPPVDADDRSRDAERGRRHGRRRDRSQRPRPRRSRRQSGSGRRRPAQGEVEEGRDGGRATPPPWTRGCSRRWASTPVKVKKKPHGRSAQLPGSAAGSRRKDILDLHPPVRDDDRRRPAAGAVPRHPRRRSRTTRPSRRSSSPIKAKVEAGSTFADALAEHPKVFDELFVQPGRAPARSAASSTRS